MERVASLGTSRERQGNGAKCAQVTLGGELGLCVYTSLGEMFVGFGPSVRLMVMGHDRVLAPEICDKYEACEINLGVAMARHVLPWATLSPIEYVVGNRGWDEWLHTSHPCQFPRSLPSHEGHIALQVHTHHNPNVLNLCNVLLSIW